MNKLTTQDVIDAASKLYDEKGYARVDILAYLTALRDTGAWPATKETLGRVYDLVVG